MEDLLMILYELGVGVEYSLEDFWNNNEEEKCK